MNEPRAEAFAQQIQDYITAALDAEAEALEALLVDAMALQDFDRLERLVVVDDGSGRRTVGSMLVEDVPAP